MGPLQACVRNGRLVLDEATDLPEGTVVTLVVDDAAEALDEPDRQALHAAIDAALRSDRAGKSSSAAELLAELRRGR